MKPPQDPITFQSKYQKKKKKNIDQPQNLIFDNITQPKIKSLTQIANNRKIDQNFLSKQQNFQHTQMEEVLKSLKILIF